MREKIYLAGLPRGGTTLFSMVLGQNSSIKQMGESMYIPILNPKDVLCSCGEKSCKILEKVYERAKIIDSIKEIPRIYGVIDKMREPQKIPHKFTLQHSCCNMNEHNFYESIVKACNGLDDLVNIFRSILGDYIYVDNTKEILFAQELLNRPDWKIVLITRDPRGMAWSSKRAGIRKDVPRPVKQKIKVYKDFSRNACEIIGLPNVFHVKYEFFCKYPIQVLKELCFFLGVKFEDGMLNFKKDRGHTLFGNRMRTNDVEIIVEDLSWKDNLRKDEIEQIIKDRDLLEYYKKLGYKLDGGLQ